MLGVQALYLYLGLLVIKCNQIHLLRILATMKRLGLHGMLQVGTLLCPVLSCPEEFDTAVCLAEVVFVLFANHVSYTYYMNHTLTHSLVRYRSSDLIVA